MDLISTLWDMDTIRFGLSFLWPIIRVAVTLAGGTFWEDGSITLP